MSCEQIFHGGLSFVLRSVCILLTDDRRVPLLYSKAFQEAVVALGIYCAAGSSVQHRELRSLIAKRFSGVFALQNAGFKVIGSQRRINRIGRIRRSIQSNDENAFVARFFYYSEHSSGVVRSNQDAFNTGAHQSFYGCNLPFIVAIKFTKAGDQLGALFLRFSRSGLSQLDEIWIDFGLRDQSDQNFSVGTRCVSSSRGTREYCKGRCRCEQGDRKAATPTPLISLRSGGLVG